MTAETPAEVLRLLAVVGTNPRLRKITIAILQGMEKEAEANAFMRDVVNDLRVPPSAQSAGPKPERVGLVGVPVLTDVSDRPHVASQEPAYQPPPYQRYVEQLTETPAERAKRTGA
jgi:hypothetical protein